MTMEPPSTNPKCFNCAGPVDPHNLNSALANPRKSDETARANDNHAQALGSAPVTDSYKLQILRFIFSADADCQRDSQLLEEALLKLKTTEEATCKNCTEQLRKMTEARDVFRSSCVSGSVMHQLQDKFTSKTKDTEVKGPASDANKAKWVTGSGREVPEVVRQAPPPKPAVSSRGEVYGDWKQAFKVAELVMVSFKRRDHKKQTIKQINDYILDKENDFYRKNTEPNVVNRILQQFFFNSTQHAYAKFGTTAPSGRGSDLQGSAALWTIHRKYSNIEIIRKELRMAHAPLQPRRQAQESRPSYPKRDREQEPQAVPQEAKSEAMTKDSEVAGPVPPAKIRRTDSGDHGHGSTSNGEVKIKVVGEKDTEEKVSPQKAESQPEPLKPKENQNTVAVPEKKQKLKAKKKPKKGGSGIKNLEKNLGIIQRVTQRLLSKMQPQTRAAALEDGKTIIDIAESMLFTTKNLYIVLDEFLIPNSDLKRPAPIMTVINFGVDVLSEYFRSLVRSEIYFRQVINSPFAIVFEIMKLKLIRLLTFQLLIPLKADESQSLVAFGDRYFTNITNCLKWNSDPATKTRVVREDWSEDGLDDMLRVWSLVLFQLERHRTQHQADDTVSASDSDSDPKSSSVGGFDVFVVNLDHKEMGPQGFKDKLDTLQKKLNVNPKPTN